MKYTEAKLIAGAINQTLGKLEDFKKEGIITENTFLDNINGLAKCRQNIQEVIMRICPEMTGEDFVDRCGI